MQASDFGNSYMTWSVLPTPNDRRKPGHKPWGNNARILLEARCVLTNEQTDESDEFFLIAPCRTEWMYQDEDLFQIPSNEYRNIYSRTRSRSMGKGITYDGGSTNSCAIEGSRFTSLSFTVTPLRGATTLQTDDEVVQATMQDLPLVAQTEIRDRDGRWQAVLEYPVKTMNFHPERRRFQVDTGPLIVPDFPALADVEHWIDALDMAHVVYNTFDRAEFIVRRPTPVMRDGKEVCSVLHYAEIRVYAARHAIVCATQQE